jgi:hypothetical protein
MTELFPSQTGSDYVVEGGFLGMDALQTVLKPGALILPQYQVNPSSHNPGSVFSSDRTVDSNIYLVFLSMATIGGLQNRHGSPDPVTFEKTTPLPWTTAATMTAEGCGYASAVVNFIDALTIASDNVSGSMAATLSNMKFTFETFVNEACDHGCKGTQPTGDVQMDPNSTWASSGCALASCAQCPFSLRDRTKCTGVNTDQISCAAAGIVNFVNSASIGWQGP